MRNAFTTCRRFMDVSLFGVSGDWNSGLGAQCEYILRMLRSLALATTARRRHFAPFHDTSVVAPHNTCKTRSEMLIAQSDDFSFFFLILDNTSGVKTD